MAATSLGVSRTALSTCSPLKPSSPSTSSATVGVIRRRSPVQCSCSRREDMTVPVESSSPRIMSRLLAAGLALAVSTSSSVAVASEVTAPLVSVTNVTQNADKLLKDADKLTNDESPPRFGPPRGGVSDSDSGRVAQKGGSGAIPELQNSGSELVGQAREKVSNKAESTKQQLGDSIGKAQDKVEEAKSGLQGLFGQAQDKVKSDVDKVKVESGEPGGKVKGLVGDASSKVKSDVDTTKDNAGGFIGSIKKGLKIQ